MGCLPITKAVYSFLGLVTTSITITTAITTKEPKVKVLIINLANKVDNCRSNCLDTYLVNRVGNFLGSSIEVNFLDMNSASKPSADIFSAERTAITYRASQLDEDLTYSVVVIRVVFAKQAEDYQPSIFTRSKEVD